MNSGLVGTGLALNVDGLLSGTPSTSGTISFTAQVIDQAGHGDEKPFSIAINPMLTIAGESLPDGTAGSPYTFQLVSSGGTGTILWADSGASLTGIGLSISPAGLLSGTVASPAVVSFTIKATDAVGSTAYSHLSINFQRGYVCGDANGDSHLNVGDAVFLINFIFKGAPSPNPNAAGDANCDSRVNVGDAVSLINYVFKSGPAPCCP
jgi:hypothetical protein